MKYVSTCVDWEREIHVNTRVFDIPSDAMKLVFDEMRAAIAAEFEPDDPDFDVLMAEVDAMTFIKRDDGSWELEADDCRYVIAPIDA